MLSRRDFFKLFGKTVAVAAVAPTVLVKACDPKPALAFHLDGKEIARTVIDDLPKAIKPKPPEDPPKRNAFVDYGGIKGVFLHVKRHGHWMKAELPTYQIANTRDCDVIDITGWDDTFRRYARGLERETITLGVYCDQSFGVVMNHHLSDLLNPAFKYVLELSMTPSPHVGRFFYKVQPLRIDTAFVVDDVARATLEFAVIGHATQKGGTFA